VITVGGYLAGQGSPAGPWGLVMLVGTTLFNQLWLVVTMDMEEDSCGGMGYYSGQLHLGRPVDQIRCMAGLLLFGVCRYLMNAI